MFDECVRELSYTRGEGLPARRNTTCRVFHVAIMAGAAAVAVVTRQKCHELDIIVRNKHNIMYGKKWRKKNKMASRRVWSIYL